MILGIGIDIVHISRMQGWRDQQRLLERFFHPEELAEAQKRGPTVTHSLAARFAAKEAYGKAMGTGMHNLRLKDIQVENDRHGKPNIILYGSAKERFEKLGGKTIFVSLSHERDNAVAVVVLEA